MSVSLASERFLKFKESLKEACLKAGRSLDEIQFLPVSKGHPVETLLEYLSLKSFPQELAENYLEELALKKKAMSEITWHYQGALQSRKIAEIVACADVLHSVCRKKELEILFQSEKCPQFYLQVNISSEGQKLGAAREEVPGLLDFISQQGKESKFLGFMGVASERVEGSSVDEIRRQFSSLRLLRDQLAPRKKLSMGMSGDFAQAIAEGADIVRIGSLIFGERNYT